MAKSKYSRFYCLVAQLSNYTAEDAVYDFTNGRTTHKTDLSALEYAQLCRYLEKLIKGIENDRRRFYGSAVLKQLQIMGIDTTSWDAVDRFLTNPRIAGMRYIELTADEHIALLWKLKQMAAKGYKHQFMNITTVCLN